jgi:putative flavoprotein involved in K+ transport
MGDFLEAYAHRFDLPVRTGQRVTRLSRDGDGFLVETQGLHIRAAQVVVAMANYQRPKLPGFAAELAPDITQIHSFDYRNPAQLKRGQVLVVGAGNSGAEIARELAAAGHHVTLSGRKTGEVPFRIDGTFGAPLLRVTLRVLFHRILTTSTPLGRKARPAVVSQGGPLIRTKWKDLTALGVEHAPRAIGTYQGRPVLEGGLSLDVANVVWCTGFHSGFEWIDFPFPTDHGRPAQVRGVVQQLPGFYFTGQHFLYAMSSAMIHGAGRDAHYVVDRIAERIAAAKG